MAEGRAASEIILIFLLLANGVSQLYECETLIFDKNI